MAGTFARTTGRHIHLVLENDENRTSLLAPDEDPPAGHYRAQWNDDYHHAWHALLTGENAGYYRDYCHARLLARTLAEGFAYQGEPSPHRKGKPRGEPSGYLPPLAFVDFLQNHDQIGNRPLGERLSVLAKPAALAAALVRVAAATLAAAAVHGRGMGRDRAVSVLLRFPGRPGGGRAQRAETRIRRSLCAAWRRNSRSAFGRDARERHARLGRARESVACGTACAPSFPSGRPETVNHSAVAGN